MKVIKILGDLSNKYRGVYAREFLIEGRKSEILNLRKILVCDIETYATEIVKQERNDNDLTNKTCDIALDLGLFHIIQNRLNDEYEYDGYYYARINKTCEKGYLDVNSEDIELIDENYEYTGIKPFKEGYRLTQLKTGQTIDLILYINKNKGSYHMKYSPGFMTMMKKEDKKTYRIRIETFGHYEIDELCNKMFEIYNMELGLSS